jgi:peptidoglycan hydrolase-like protein with peptidoglycan-binding domain
MNLKTKAVGLVAAFALVLGAAAPASAATTSELIDLLVSMGIISADQVAVVNAAVGGSTSSDSCGLKTAPDMTLGSTGANVTELQMMLVDGGYLVMPAGVDYGYFGGLTQSALASYQAAMGISPAAGYFGPVTKASIVCEMSEDMDDDDDSSVSGLGSGEASLEDFDLEDEEDEVAEGESEVVATIEFDVEDGDVELQRADLTFLFAGNTVDGADDEPWDVLEEVSLWVDGDEIASEDVSDEDDWLDDDSPFKFRFSNIDEMFMDGDEVEIEVQVTAQDGVDGDLDGDAKWTVYVAEDDIRAVDGEGIDQYIGSDSTANRATFDITEEGGDESIEIKSTSADIDSSVLLVDEDNTSDEFGVFVFELEAEENDIEIDEIVLNVILSGTSTIGGVIEDIYLEIDGDEYNDEEFATTTLSSSNVTFDIDGDLTIDEDDEVEVAVFVKFKDQEGNYNIGTTIQVQTVSVDGEGADDVSDTATVSGETHTLNTAVGEVTNVSWTESVSESGTSGNIDLRFTISAEEDDFEVLGADIIDTILGDTFGATGTVATDSNEGTLTRVSGDSVASIPGGFRVSEGDTTTFRVRYSASSAGSYEVSVDSVAGQELDDEDQLSPTMLLDA